MKQTLLTLLALCLLTVGAALAATSDSRRITAPAAVNQPGAERRVALVIGNSAYTNSPLKNPVNDARLIAATLKEAGFELYGGKAFENLVYQQMMEAVEGFGSALATGGVGMVFYAGHGMQSGGANYLIPVDASIKGENELSFRAINAGYLLAKMEQAKSRVNIVVLDACRNNPFGRSFRSSASGLSPMTAPAGTLVAYSTGPGSVAEDGLGANSLYSEALATALKTKGVSIEEAFKLVRSQVRQKTNNNQTPWENTSLEGTFVFIENAVISGPVTVSSNVDNRADAEAWEIIKLSSDPEEYRAFLKEYPNSTFAGAARLKLRQLEKPPLATTVVAAVSPPAVVAINAPYTDPTTGMEFVPVKGGCFQMGDNFGDGDKDERPVHEVCVSDFSMGKYEVTVGQFLRFVLANKYQTDAEKGDGCRIWSGVTWETKSGTSWKDFGFFEDEMNHPVACVSWNDGAAYAKWLSEKSGKSYRLPTEAEWEYAARSGGQKERYAGGNDAETVAWYNINSGSKTHPVGQKKVNGLGLYDMSGNLWEWVSDWNGSYLSERQQDPTGPVTGSYRGYRGGSWHNDPSYVRASIRNGSTADNGYYILGFRLVSPVQ